jgi:hypothetical protein
MTINKKSPIGLSVGFPLRSFAAFLAVALLLLSATTVTAQERSGKYCWNRQRSKRRATTRCGGDLD